MRAQSRTLALVAVAGLCPAARAGWELHYYHPGGNSVIRSVRSNQAVLISNIESYRVAANSLVTNGLGVGFALKTDGVQQVGYQGWIEPTGVPVVWTGTPGSVTQLTPPGIPNFLGGRATGVFQGMQVGYVISGFSDWYERAGFWNDTAETWTELMPPTAVRSRAEDVHMGAIVGYARFGSNANTDHATIWYNSPTNYVDLNNNAFMGSSTALGVFNGQQCGWYTPIASNQRRAVRWSNTAASAVDLHPPIPGVSEAAATYLGKQVGFIEAGPGEAHAVIWYNTAASMVDLHPYMPPQVYSSFAYGVWTDNANFYTYVVGLARANDGDHGVIWRHTPDQFLTGNLNLLDTVPAFAATRNISYTLTQGVAILGSGTIQCTASSTAISVPTSVLNTGAAVLTLNGSSFCLRKFNVNLTGSNQNIGTVTMLNGDCDFSGEVDAADIDLVIALFGDITSGPTDVDVSGEVDATDIDIIIAEFGNLDD